MASKILDLLTICGLDEIARHGARGVSHVLSILDPETPEPDFAAYGATSRTVLRFHDIVGPMPGMIAPRREDVEAVLAFGRTLDDGSPTEGHLLVHCHMGISRSTAAMITILAQAYPERGEDEIVRQIASLRPQAWPNLLMIEFADELLGRAGRLRAAAVALYARALVVRPDFAEALVRLGRTREVEAARALA